MLTALLLAGSLVPLAAMLVSLLAFARIRRREEVATLARREAP